MIYIIYTNFSLLFLDMNHRVRHAINISSRPTTNLSCTGSLTYYTSSVDRGEGVEEGPHVLFDVQTPLKMNPYTRFVQTPLEY